MSKNPIQRALIGRFKDEVLRIVRAENPATILEVGCGEGFMLDVVANAGVRADLMGIDISEPAVAEARQRLGTRATVEVLDARDLAKETRRFDLVMMLEVLEHLDRPEEMLPILEQLTNGPVLVSVPWEPFFCALNFLRGKNVARWGNDPEHVNHWTRSGFFEFVRQRFDVIETPQVFPWTMALLRSRPAATSP